MVEAAKAEQLALTRKGLGFHVLTSSNRLFRTLCVVHAKSLELVCLGSQHKEQKVELELIQRQLSVSTETTDYTNS